MKQTFLLLAAMIFIVAGATAQEKVDSLPYQKYPTLPAFNIMLTDSSTIFNTYNIPSGKPIVIIFFDPGCSHCQWETKRLLEGMDSLKNIRFYMVSSVHNMSEIRKFYNDYHLGDHKEIEAVGRDYEYFFLGYYGVRYVPDLVVYDEHKKLVKLFESNATVQQLYDLTHTHQ